MVRSLFRMSGVRSLHKNQLLFPAAVIMVVGGVLADGALERTAQAERQPAAEAALAAADPAPPILTRPALRGDLEKTPLTYFADYWAQLAAHVGPHVVALGPSSVGGVVLAPGLALTTTEAVDAVAAEVARWQLARAGPTASRPGTEPERLAVRGVDPALGLAVVAVDAAVPPFPATGLETTTSGAYVGIVSRAGAGPPAIVPGHFVAVSSSRSMDGELTISVAPPDRGVAAVVDLDGLLLGVTFRSPAGPRTLSVPAARRTIDRMGPVERCRAIVVSPLDTRVLALLEVDAAVVVADVAAEAFSPEPSLRPGDVLLEWDGARVRTVEDFETGYDATAPGTLVRFRGIRDGRALSGGTVMPDAECRAAAARPARLLRLGVVLGWHPASATGQAGWLARVVAPGGAAAAAGVREGDVVVAVDGRPVDRLDDRSTLVQLDARSEPALLTVRRGRRVALMAIASSGPP